MKEWKKGTKGEKVNDRPLKKKNWIIEIMRVRILRVIC